MTREVTTNVDEPQWWWCLDHSAVEDAEGCRGEVRMGPYATFDEAAHALDHARQRTAEWDADD